MPFLLREENDTENPILAQVYGNQIGTGKLVYYLKVGGRKQVILILGAGEMDGIDQLYYNGELISEFTAMRQDTPPTPGIDVPETAPDRNWKFHPGTKTTQITPFDVTDIPANDTLRLASNPFTTNLTVIETVTATSGTRKFFFGSTGTTSTADIAYNETAANIQTALRALTNLSPNKVTVTALGGGKFKYVFDSSVASLMPTFNTDPALLIGGTSTITRTHEVALVAGVDPKVSPYPTGVKQHRKLYVVYSSGNDIKLSLTENGPAINTWPNTAGSAKTYLVDNLKVYQANAGYFDPIQGRPEFFSDSFFLTNGNGLDLIEFTFSEIAYVEVRLPSSMSEGDDAPEDFKIFVRGKRLQNYDSAGLLADQNGVTYPDQNNLPAQTKFFSANNALVAIDIMLNSMKISPDRINWATFVKYRDYCKEGIGWDSGTVPAFAHPNWQGLAPISGSTLTNVTEDPPKTFKKTGVTNAWDAGGISTNSLSDAINPIEMAGTYVSGVVALGLTKNVGVVTDPNSSLYTARVDANGHLSFYRLGALLYEITTDDYVKPLDQLRITIDATNVNFYRNGVLLYTEAKSLGAAANVKAMFSLYSSDGKVKNLKFIYRGLINMVESPVGVLTKGNLSGAWDAVGMSFQAGTVTSSVIDDDRVEINAVYGDGNAAIGLTQGTSPDVTFTNALYTFEVFSTQHIRVRRYGSILYGPGQGYNGVPGQTLGPVVPGDRLKVVITKTIDPITQQVTQRVSFQLNDEEKYGANLSLDGTNPNNPIHGVVFIANPTRANGNPNTWSDIKFFPVTGEGRFITRFDAHVVYPNTIDCPTALQQIFGRSPGCHWQDVNGKISFIVGPNFKNLLTNEPATAGDRVLVKLISFDPTQTTIKSNIVENSFSTYKKPPDQKQNFLRVEYRDLGDEFFTKRYVFGDRPNLRDYIDSLIDFGIVQIGVATQSLADRISESILRWNSDLDLFVTVKGMADTFTIAKGDIVKFAHDVPGWTIDEAPLFIVLEESFDPETADERTFSLQVYNPEFYSDIDHGAISALLPPSEADPLLPPTSVDYTWDGVRLTLNWTPSPTLDVAAYVIRDESNRFIAQVDRNQLSYSQSVQEAIVTRRIYALRSVTNEESSTYVQTTFVKPTATMRWTNRTGVSVGINNRLTKTAATGWDNAGAILDKAVLTDRVPASLTMQPDRNDTYQIVGFTNTPNVDGLTDFEFAVYFTASGTVEARYHNNTETVFIGSYVAGDKFILKITPDLNYISLVQLFQDRIVNGVHTDVLLYTFPYTYSRVTPYYAGVALYTNGSVSSLNLRLSGDLVNAIGDDPTFHNLVNASYAANTLTGTGGSGDGSSGASTLTQLRALEDGGWKFRAFGEMAVGLSVDDLNQTYADIEFALRITSGYLVNIYHNGTFIQAANGGNPINGATDIFVGRENGFPVVRFNGVLDYVYTGASTALKENPLYLDVAFRNDIVGGSNISQIKQYNNITILRDKNLETIPITLDMFDTAVVGENLAAEIPPFEISTTPVEGEVLVYDAFGKVTNSSISDLIGSGTEGYIPVWDAGGTSFIDSHFFDFTFSGQIGFNDPSGIGALVDTGVLHLGDSFGGVTVISIDNTNTKITLRAPTIKLDSLTAKGTLYLDSTKNIVSQTLNDGEILVGSTGNIPVVTSWRQFLAKHVHSQASTATLTANVDLYDTEILTAQAAALSIAAPTGTPTSEQRLEYRIKDDGTARTIAWNAVFNDPSGLLPATTTVGTTHRIGTVYNSTTAKYDVVAVWPPAAFPAHIDGAGTTNYISRWLDSDTIIDTHIWEEDTKQIIIGKGFGTNYSQIWIDDVTKLISLGDVAGIQNSTKLELDDSNLRMTVWYPYIKLPYHAANSVLYLEGTYHITGSPLNDGQLLIGATSGAPTPANISAGTGIGISNGAGSITVSITDAELVALAGLVSAANKLPYFTGSGTAALTDFSASGRSIVNLTLAQGDLIYGSAANTASILAKNTTATRYLANTGVGNNPAWSQVDLSNGVTSKLAEANGGTNQTGYAQGDILYASALNTLSKLAKSTTTGHFLSNSGASNNPAWANPLTVGNPVSSGGANRVLFEDGSQNLGTDSGLTFSSSNLNAPKVTIASNSVGLVLGSSGTLSIYEDDSLDVNTTSAYISGSRVNTALRIISSSTTIRLLAYTTAGEGYFQVGATGGSNNGKWFFSGINGADATSVNFATPTVTFAPASGDISMYSKIPATNNYVQYAFRNPSNNQVAFFGYIGSTFGDATRNDHFEIGAMTGRNIYFRPGDSGNLMIMTSGGDMSIGNNITPSARLHLVGTTEQLRIGYDTSSYYSTTVNSSGGVTFDAVGITAGFTFADAVLLNAKVTKYNNINTAGWGIPAIQAAGRATAQTGANASVATYTVGGADGTFYVSANVLVTTSSAENFSVTCAYTDEGNTARTLTLTFGLVAGGVTTTGIKSAQGAVPYMGVPVHIRCKASTTITIATTGTFTGCTYNVEAIITQKA